MSKKKLYISVHKELGYFLISREAARRLMTLVKQRSSHMVEIDFADVEFMSRSFAYQFQEERKTIKSTFGTAVKTINANEEITNMLRIVSFTLNKTELEYRKIRTYKITNPYLLSDYLFSF